MGVDSEKENLKNSSFNGDALMLLTFNPKTLNTTIMSIPRDSYVPIACFENKMKNKITHAAMYGEECMINTIEDFTGIDIDYYVKINFKGVVKIVDKLGGITVDVPYSFCEQNSDRLWGENTIYVKKGIQTLNGEQALALSRNRKNNTSKCSSEYTSGYRSDFVRGDNQQLVLKATINKLKEINNLNTIYDLLEIASNNIETNMNTNQILSLYNIAKDLLSKSNNYDMTDLLGFQKLYLSGYDARLYDERTGLYLYDYVLYEESIKEVSKAMKVNLELEEPEIIKTFSFDINEEVEEKIIGKGNYQKETLPSFIGKTEAEAKKLSSSLNLKVTIKYLESSKESGIVLYQNYSKGTDINKVSNLILTVSKKASINNNKQTNNKESEKEEVEEKQNDDDNLELDDITGIEGLE
jgi:LCP family protein required for cell wall assembly